MRAGNAPIVHIGYHKTGSSWLQEQVFPRVRNAHFVPRRVVRESLLVPHAFRFDPETARRTLAGDATGRLLISEEELSGNLQTAGANGSYSKEIAERIHRTLPDAHILILVRDQRTMLASAYKQYVKGGGTRSMRGYLREPKAPHKSSGFSLDFLRYDVLVEHYEALFGSGRVTVRTFEALRAQPRVFLAELTEALDLEIEEGTQAVSTDAVNPSLRRHTLALMRFLNLFHGRKTPNSTIAVNVPGLYRPLRGLMGWLDRLPLSASPGFDALLDAASRARVEDVFREANERLEKRHPLGLRAAGYPMPRDGSPS